ncbi:hypothetical protein N836_32895 [Leptolyngbya sp. Heron Island J]|nr:hypothetical protein N836_32895 [Leptolyngbya sp. Heron Island J]
MGYILAMIRVAIARSKLVQRVPKTNSKGPRTQPTVRHSSRLSILKVFLMNMKASLTKQVQLTLHMK